MKKGERMSKKYKFNLGATLILYADNSHEAMEKALDYCSEIEYPGEIVVNIIDDPICEEDDEE